MNLISVTTALSPWADFSMIPPDVLAQAAARGTAVHAACAAYCLGLFAGDLSDDEKGYFISFKTWFDKYVDRVFFVEQELVDRDLGIIGHTDAGIKLIDGRNMISDWKTPAALQKTWGPQCSAYLHLAKINSPFAHDKNINFWDGCMSLRLRQDGGPAKAEVYQFSGEMFAIFLSSLNCYRYFKGGMA